ncbi:MAG: ABC transporter ATP-binding protein [Brooklawnia sp.]|uniref:ABC transporter ATP-binding protein n=1 Tax=Brooklawnia sp. TaxID=2699740 RepID=UPI003C71D2D6
MPLELRGITKRYGDVLANDGIDFEVLRGEIHALLGENGAGKTTLVRVLAGLTRPDAGSITLDGRVGMVHQHFRLIESFTVTENIILGREPGRGPWLDLTAGRHLVAELSTRYGLELDPDAVVGELPIGVRQRVEIVKALADDADWLVLDEPTAVLRPQEIDQLMGVLRRLRADGRGIVLITHRLAEATAVADRITVLRAGRVVAEAPPSTPHQRLAELMVGRAVPPAELGTGRPGAEVRATVWGIELRAGEVLGVAGVQGNGQAELVAAVRAAVHDLAYVPEDRLAAGLVEELSVAENLVLNQLADFTRLGLLRRDRMRRVAEQRAADFGIQTDVRRPVAVLSGGNQQRVVLARELSQPSGVLLACEPTRGLDVSAAAFVHQRIAAVRDAGAAVLLVSSDLDELTRLSDRIAVLHRRRIVAVVPPGVSRARLGLLMAGVSDA